MINIVNCGPGCHVLVTESDEVVDATVDHVEIPVTASGDDRLDDRVYRELEAQGRESTDIAWVTIMFYYSSQYKAKYNPKSEINAIIANMNRGYISSGVNVRARSFCSEEMAGVDESKDAVTILGRFRGGKAANIARFREGK